MLAIGIVLGKLNRVASNMLAVLSAQVDHACAVINLPCRIIVEPCGLVLPIALSILTSCAEVPAVMKKAILHNPRIEAWRADEQLTIYP